ncbi:VOC family protein [Nocardioides euryhalodurans]|uniref:VOC family protein n=1 Tax=Nocardioides euryhalodurans TaxID=2518370 RepID=A0A4P7GN47_9ACTN|nr:VOC family protein [Nocardioides euryhalodurans]QBR93596.1 VOC family protein [Nocardioides euryhalodurans]
MTPFWVSAFLDLAPEAYDDGLAFWSGVTGAAVSATRGAAGELVSLVPAEGDGHLRVQRLVAGRSRIHLDLHVDDPRAAADRAVALGAREVADVGHVVMASPGGLPFCLVTHPAATPAAAVDWGGHSSAVDQVCVDVPHELHDREVAFWQALTGRVLAPSPGHAEFQRLHRPDGEPLHLLLQRLGEPLGEVRGHLDLATSDRAAETARHVALGATEVATFDSWTVLTDPAGSAYCITDREPR